MRIVLLLLAFAARVAADPAPADEYPWLRAGDERDRLADRFAPPPGFHRVAVTAGSFAAWLRGLPLRDRGTPVRSFRGDEIHAGDDRRVAAVIDLDVGTRDLQQCADSIMRLDAEWRYSTGHGEQIRYPIGHGSTLAFTRWAAGDRPRIGDRDQVTWVHRTKADDSHTALRSYLDVVFAWAGTESLADSLRSVARTDLRAGDFFVLGGHPGHAVLVLDLAVDSQGHRRALLGQGYMPAQDFHVVAHDGDPWFVLDDEVIETPFWDPFPWRSLRRLP